MYQGAARGAQGYHLSGIIQDWERLHSHDPAKSMIRRLRDNPGLGYALVGVVAEKSGAREVEGVKVVGTLPGLRKLIARMEPNEVLFALPAGYLTRLEPLLVELQDTPLWGHHQPRGDRRAVGGACLRDEGSAPEQPLELFPQAFLRPGRGVPRVRVGPPGDGALRGGGAAFLARAHPVQATAGDGKCFNMYKFRSMRVGSETAAFTQKNDPRRTAFGTLLRRTSLDELPQLYNVLQGRMSLVGPRPEVPALVAKFEKTVPRYFERHQVKSGITGWAQVHGLRGNTSIEERVRFDIYYIENWSLWLDVTILFRTVLDILEHRHAY